MRLINSKVCVCADIHLGLHLSSSIWHDISLNCALRLKQELVDRGIKDIIILGDTVDNRNEVSVTTLYIMYKFFKILEDFNIVIIPGNHDCYYTRRSDVHSLGTLKYWPNISIVDTPLTVQLFGKTLTFCPWNTPLENVPKSDILFGHFEVNTFKMNGNHICDHGVDSQELLNKSELILSGHFHKREERKYKNGTILYVGSPYEQNWGECGDQKGVYLLDILDNTLDFIPNTKSPKHIKIRLSELLAVGKITDNIKSEFKGNIINFIIDKEIEQKSIDTLLTKFYTLNPISIKTENTILMGNAIATDEIFQFEGIDIKNDIISFIDNSSDVENKTGLIKYLVDVYDQCYEVKK